MIREGKKEKKATKTCVSESNKKYIREGVMDKKAVSSSKEGRAREGGREGKKESTQRTKHIYKESSSQWEEHRRPYFPAFVMYGVV